MASRILIVPDKFKGTLTARAAAEAMAAGWLKARPQDRVELLPMSDGGDGFGEVLGSLLRARIRTVRTLDAAHRPIAAHWWLARQPGTAIIEAAQVNGLALLPRGEFHPYKLDTFGLGKVLRAAARSGASRIIIGVGGSSTNDGGFGLARGLGWRFFDGDAHEILEWPDLHRLARVERGAFDSRAKLTVAVDVANPLLGVGGCSRVYGPQKGLRPRDFAGAEKSLRRLATLLKQQHGLDFASVPGAGAAGGLGFGFCAFAGAQIESGFDLFASAANLAQRIAASDIVLTGEGKIDRQTHMGKGVGRVAMMCAKLKVPCIGLAGILNEPRKLFSKTAAVTGITSRENALNRPAFFLSELSRKIASEADAIW
jgi:glycerate kinase